MSKFFKWIAASSLVILGLSYIVDRYSAGCQKERDRQLHEEILLAIKNYENITPILQRFSDEGLMYFYKYIEHFLCTETTSEYCELIKKLVSIEMAKRKLTK